MGITKIEWCDETVNPIKVKGGGWHCTKVSAGCKNCYAERINNRFGNSVPYDDRIVEYELDLSCFDKLPKKPKRVFVQSMGDLFHKNLSPRDRQLIFFTIKQAHWHTFVVLTKRPFNALNFFVDYPEYRHLPNLQLGVSVENQATADERIPILLQIPAAVRFISAEPLLGNIDLQDYLRGVPKHGFNRLNGVIVGGESGPGAGPMSPDRVRKIRDDCKAAGVPFFFKQWGEWLHFSQCITDDMIVKHAASKQAWYGSKYAKVGKTAAGNLLDGRRHEELPEARI